MVWVFTNVWVKYQNIRSRETEIINYTNLLNADTNYNDECKCKHVYLHLWLAWLEMAAY